MNHQAFTRSYTHDTRLLYRGLCGARTSSLIECEDDMGRYCDSNFNLLYSCGLPEGHEGVHRGWDNTGDNYSIWTSESSCLQQLYEPSRWEITMETEFFTSDCEWRIEVIMDRGYRGYEYTPNDGMPEDR
jgi:hypothetical protein